MLKEIVNEKLRKAKEDFLSLENHSECDYYGMLVLLVSNDENTGLKHLQIESAAVKNAESEDFSENNVISLGDSYIDEKFNLSEFKNCIVEFEKEYEEDFSVIIPEIYWLLNFWDFEDVSSDTVIQIIDEAIEKKDCAFEPGIGFRIIRREA